MATLKNSPRLALISFGATSAIVTSVGLIVGFGSADISKSAMISGLLIVGLVDNLTDTPNIHIFQESALLEQRTAFRLTMANFLTGHALPAPSSFSRFCCRERSRFLHASRGA